MKDIEYLVSIYTNEIITEDNQETFYILYLLDDKGPYDINKAWKLYLDEFSAIKDATLTDGMIGPFASFEKLNQYAFTLCERLNAARISLVSVSEYNTMLESTQNTADFKRNLFEEGNVLENVERKNKKSGFLSRLFE